MTDLADALNARGVRFNGIQPNTYNDGTDDWWHINSIARVAVVIAFSYDRNEFTPIACPDRILMAEHQAYSRWS